MGARRLHTTPGNDHDMRVIAAGICTFGKKSWLYHSTNNISLLPNLAQGQKTHSHTHTPLPEIQCH